MVVLEIRTRRHGTGGAGSPGARSAHWPLERFKPAAALGVAQSDQGLAIIQRSAPVACKTNPTQLLNTATATGSLVIRPATPGAVV
ncbi:MAG: hypothetical protein QOJ99_2820 [Bryobacterales bacterium]|jgi:hypothetical protein|nr:hypothetical protein [Bryobacterales bacterium]